MNSLKDLRLAVINTGQMIKFKTSGDVCNITGCKVYAMFLSNKRISPFYTVKEWDLFKIDKVLKANDLK